MNTPVLITRMPSSGPNFGISAGAFGSLKALDPVRQLVAKLFYLLFVFENSWVVPFSVPQQVFPGSFGLL
jgi:hypothetical protein